MPEGSFPNEKLQIVVRKGDRALFFSMDPNSKRMNDEDFVAMVARQQPALKAIVRSMLPGCSEVDDILQETNMVLWRKRNTFEPGSQFGAWSGTIARFQVLAWIKRSRSDKFEFFDGSVLEKIGSTSEISVEAVNRRREALSHCLAALSKANRELIEHRYFVKSPLAEYAARHKKSVAAVSKILERLRSSLRDCITKRMAV